MRDGKGCPVGLSGVITVCEPELQHTATGPPRKVKNGSDRSFSSKLLLPFGFADRRRHMSRFVYEIKSVSYVWLTGIVISPWGSSFPWHRRPPTTILYVLCYRRISLYRFRVFRPMGRRGTSLKVGLMLGQRRGRWPNIKRTLGKRNVFVGTPRARVMCNNDKFVHIEISKNNYWGSQWELYAHPFYEVLFWSAKPKGSNCLLSK